MRMLRARRQLSVVSDRFEATVCNAAEVIAPSILLSLMSIPDIR